MPLAYSCYTLRIAVQSQGGKAQSRSVFWAGFCIELLRAMAMLLRDNFRKGRAVGFHPVMY